MRPVELLLNSFRADAVFVYVEGRADPVRCSAVDSAARTAFDSKCPIDIVGLSGEVELQIFRVVDGTPAPPDTLTIWLPGR